VRLSGSVNFTVKVGPVFGVKEIPVRPIAEMNRDDCRASLKAR